MCVLSPPEGGQVASVAGPSHGCHLPPPRILPGAAQCGLVVLQVVSRWSLSAGASQPGFLTSHLWEALWNFADTAVPCQTFDLFPYFPTRSPFYLVVIVLSSPTLTWSPRWPGIAAQAGFRVHLSCRVDHVVAFGKTRMFWAHLTLFCPGSAPAFSQGSPSPFSVNWARTDGARGPWVLLLLQPLPTSVSVWPMPVYLPPRAVSSFPPSLCL